MDTEQHHYKARVGLVSFRELCISGKTAVLRHNHPEIYIQACFIAWCVEHSHVFQTHPLYKSVPAEILSLFCHRMENDL